MPSIVQPSRHLFRVVQRLIDPGRAPAVSCTAAGEHADVRLDAELPHQCRAEHAELDLVLYGPALVDADGREEEEPVRPAS